LFTHIYYNTDIAKKKVLFYIFSNFFQNMQSIRKTLSA